MPSVIDIGWSTSTRRISTKMPILVMAGRRAASAAGSAHIPRAWPTSFVLGLYLYNEGEVRLWPYARANGENTIDVLRRLRAEWPDRP